MRRRFYDEDEEPRYSINKNMGALWEYEEDIFDNMGRQPTKGEAVLDSALDRINEAYTAFADALVKGRQAFSKRNVRLVTGDGPIQSKEVADLIDKIISGLHRI
jgi:hypothetical protein